MRFVLFLLMAVIVMTAAFFAFRPRVADSSSTVAAPPPAPVASGSANVADAMPATAASSSPASAAADGGAASTAGTARAPAVAASAAGDAPAPASGVVTLVVAKGRLVEGPSVVKATVGDRISMRITSDADDELHLHGYNLKLRLRAGVPATLAFQAGRSGRFTYELHRRDVELGALEVYPATTR